ncbi:5079_t:CDS:2, partial [Cetraspora pellucida]
YSYMLGIGWSKLTLNELKDLKCYSKSGVRDDEDLDNIIEVLRIDADERNWNNGRDADLKLDDMHKAKQIIVNMFLLALGKIEMKMERNFSALYRKIEECDLLDEAWPKVSLSKPQDQHEYDFLVKISKRLDKAIKVVPMANKKDFDTATLRLADNKGWSTALQIVGSIRGKDILHLRLIQKEMKVIRIKGDIIEAFNPFVTEEPLGFQNVKESLTASTIEALVTSPSAALLQVLEPPPSQRMKNDHTWTLFLEDCLRKKGCGNYNHSKMDVSRVVANVNIYDNRYVAPVSSSGFIYQKNFRRNEIMKKPELTVCGSKNRLVKMLLAKAQTLSKKTVLDSWNKQLDKAWNVYKDFCKVMNLKAFPSKVDILVSFIVWLDLTQSISGCIDVLAAVSRAYLEVQLTDPSKEYRVKRVYRTLLKDYRKAKDPNWPCDPLTVAALNLKLKDIKFGEKLFWVHISPSKTDQFANGKFISIEYSNSKYCPKQSTVVSAIVKRIAENAGLQGRFTAHSIRIGGATAAMEADMSLAQIQAIRGWDSKSVMLYLRTVGTTNLMFSKKMGF